ncbi:MAG: glycosyltransferase family 39 protein [Sterolibacteriaceae bacterium]|uniref:ArnT family glycosyltransferase n=1 Tax=Sulfuritalea sp. TaxID=2480090 RepID=UPI001A5553B3|nr:glycosyltransferase family 39 protein [Sulfuritalea sp.]MBL8480059.1 glycosyltransferase family 39 protein [Sterolibacteriaceae bacterium]MBN8475088.1 glycosyltransferase family 39 protein [Sulfuritalea sp.]
MTGRLFAALLVLTLAFRSWLAAAFPITGDEAYFIWWGWRPDWGFYDHPPMIGWWLAALSTVSEAEWWLRLPVILQPALLALAVYWALPNLLSGVGEQRRLWAATLVLLAPVNVWNVFITTDTPLVYFSVFSGLAWIRAARDDSRRWYLAAGLLLAGAVLSKYFAAILGFAYLVDALRRRKRGALAGVAIAYGCTLPALVLMAWWNSANCWPNFMFNFVNRHGDAGWSLKTPVLYAVTLVYVMGPPVLWLAWKNRRSASADFSATTLPPPGLGTLAWLPFLLFAVLAAVKQIGLHWLLSFVPFTLIWLTLRLQPSTLQKLGLFFAGFATLHIAAILVASRVPLEAWQKTRLYDGIVLSFEHRAIGRELETDRKDRVLAMDGYSNAVTLGYNLRQYVAVFGEASSHARHDDLLTDFRTLDGHNFLILRKSEPGPDDYRRYFRSVGVDSFEVRGARFWRVKGEGFDYAAYRDGVLAGVRQKYYAIPAWLPQTACYMCDRYFSGEACRR